MNDEYIRLQREAKSKLKLNEDIGKAKGALKSIGIRLKVINKTLEHPDIDKLIAEAEKVYNEL